MGDIGKHFPDTDPRFKGIDSRLLLRHVMGLLADNGFTVANADITVIAQAPKLAPYIDAMRETVAADMGLAKDRVSVKATTTERLGFTGRKEGIAALASVLIVKA